MAALVGDNHLKAILIAIAGGNDDGMHKFNLRLVVPIKHGIVSQDEAEWNSSYPDEVKMNPKGIFLSQGRGGIPKQ